MIKAMIPFLMFCMGIFGGNSMGIAREKCSPSLLFEKDGKKEAILQIKVRSRKIYLARIRGKNIYRIECFSAKGESEKLLEMKNDSMNTYTGGRFTLDASENPVIAYYVKNRSSASKYRMPDNQTAGFSWKGKRSRDGFKTRGMICDLIYWHNEPLLSFLAEAQNYDLKSTHFSRQGVFAASGGSGRVQKSLLTAIRTGYIYSGRDDLCQLHCFKARGHASAYEVVPLKNCRKEKYREIEYQHLSPEKAALARQYDPWPPVLAKLMSRENTVFAVYYQRPGEESLRIEVLEYPQHRQSLIRIPLGSSRFIDADIEGVSLYLLTRDQASKVYQIWRIEHFSPMSDSAG